MLRIQAEAGQEIGKEGGCPKVQTVLRVEPLRSYGSDSLSRTDSRHEGFSKRDAVVVINRADRSMSPLQITKGLSEA